EGEPQSDQPDGGPQRRAGHLSPLSKRNPADDKRSRRGGSGTCLGGSQPRRGGSLNRRSASSGWRSFCFPFAHTQPVDWVPLGSDPAFFGLPPAVCPADAFVKGFFTGTPTGIRTPVSWLRTMHPRPLDDGGVCHGHA